MHDWYFSSTLEEAPTSSLIGTCFMEDLAYMYGIHHFLVLVHGGLQVFIHSYMAYWWIHMVGILVDAHW